MVMMITSTICWGSWANTYKLTKGYRFELFYWDYAVGIFLISLLYALTLGSIGNDASSFMNNVRAADGSNIVYALIGGFIFNIANLLLVAGIEMAGLAIAFPLSIGIALVEGVVLSYALQPKGDATLLAVGVALAIVAVILDGKAYSALKAGASAVSRKSVVVCVVSGLLMGAFAPFGGPVDFSGYFRARPVDHLLGILGGFIWGTGTVFNFVAAGLVGVAIAYAIGQAAPMVAALWGVLVWNEFQGANARAKLYLAGMFVSYLLALVMISRAYTAG
jgi:glucose uptake protein